DQGLQGLPAPRQRRRPGRRRGHRRRLHRGGHLLHHLLPRAAHRARGWRRCRRRRARGGPAEVHLGQLRQPADHLRAHRGGRLLRRGSPDEEAAGAARRGRGGRPRRTDPGRAAGRDPRSAARPAKGPSCPPPLASSRRDPARGPL
ncbi:MAG: Large-conductance mechanosensitive channel, partial [uncultured Friedmanniella sp.]